MGKRGDGEEKGGQAAGVLGAQGVGQEEKWQALGQTTKQQA